MTERRLTISRLFQPQPRYKQLAGYWADRKVRLWGRWLERSSFECSDQMQIQAQPGPTEPRRGG